VPSPMKRPRSLPARRAVLACLIAAAVQPPSAAGARAYGAAAAAGDAPTLILRGGRVFDASEQRAGAPVQVWIGGERILAIEPAETAIPEGVDVVDTRGCTLLPGLFDLHVHTAVAGSGGILLLDPTENLRTQLFFGVTHVVDLHGDQRTIFARRERARSAPDQARLYSAGAAFTVPGGHGTQFFIQANTVTSVDEADRRFDELLPYEPDVVKAILEHGGWGGNPELPTLDGELFEAIARRTHAEGLRLFAHVFSLAEARTAVARGADALVHGVFLDEIDDDLVDEMRTRGVAYVPTLAVVVGAQEAARGPTPYDHPSVAAALHPAVAMAISQPGSTGWPGYADLAGREQRFFGNLKRLADAGVRIGTGTDAGNPLTPHGPALLVELELFVRAGLTPARALRAATLDAARILGVEADFGTLEPGKVADVVVVRGDPTVDIAALWNVEDVFKAGRRVDRERPIAGNGRH